MAEKIDAIKEELTATPTEALEAFVEKYASDSRTGVQKLVDTAKKRMDKLQKEMIRTENLKKYEKEYDTYTYICGIDEVGRGPLAGPVVAGAVILPKDCDILYINDSKKLSAAKREELYDIIMEQAVDLARSVRTGLMRSIFCRQRMRQCGRRLHSYLRSRICCLMMQ